MKYIPVEIYTDGSCHPNRRSGGGGGRGSWAAVLINGKYKKRVYGYNPNTTSNEMELYAATKALSHLKSPCQVTIYSDSMYVVGQGNKCIAAKKMVVKTHQDLWTIFLKLALKHKVRLKWVKGHAGNKYNVMCDKLCDVAYAKGKDECVDYNRQMRNVIKGKKYVDEKEPTLLKKKVKDTKDKKAREKVNKVSKYEGLSKEEVKKKIKLKLRALMELIDLL